jgi:hypothetical protein
MSDRLTQEMFPSHRWPRATTTSGNYGRICECGNLKTDQALTCFDCAVERRRAPDYWERRTCQRCGGPRMSRKPGGGICRPCRNELMRRVSVDSGRPQPADHRWRRAA